MTTWDEVALGDHVDLLTGFPFKSAKFTSAEDSVRLLKGSAVSQGDLDWNGSVGWPSNEVADYRRFELKFGDVVLAMDRPWVEAGLKYAWIRADDLPCLLVQRVARLRGRNGLDTTFLRYLIGGPKFTNYIAPIVTGVNVPHISPRQIGSFRFKLPPTHIQLKIAAILSAYDEHIENNMRRIKILEEMAQRTYREWFVDFRYPGHQELRLVDSHLGRVPEGWEVVPLSSVCERITDGAHQSPPTAFQGKPMASVKDMTSLGIDLTSCRRIGVGDFEVLARQHCQPQVNDVLIAKDGSYLKHVFVMREATEVVILSSIALLRPNNSMHPDVLSLSLQQPETRDRLKGFVSGVAIPRIVLKDFRVFPILKPPEALQARLVEQVRPLMHLAVTLDKTIRLLRNTRDFLLPRLISGEIDVSDLDIAMLPSVP